MASSLAVFSGSLEVPFCQIAQVPLRCSLDLCQCVSTAIIQHLFPCVKVQKVANHQKKRNPRFVRAE